MATDQQIHGDLEELQGKLNAAERAINAVRFTPVSNLWFYEKQMREAQNSLHDGQSMLGKIRAKTS